MPAGAARRLLAGECVDRDVVLALREAGHDVLYIAEAGPGFTDRAVLELAVCEGCILLTEDTDFGELVVRHRLPAVGVILVRLAQEPAAEKARRVLAALGRHAGQVHGGFLVIGANGERCRPLLG